MHIMNHLIHLLQADGAPQGGAQPGGGMTQTIVVLVGMFVIFYFLLIRPQQKEQKRRREMIAGVKKHDKIISTGGIHGVVVAVSDTDITLKVDENNNVRIKLLRSAIASVIEDSESK